MISTSSPDQDVIAAWDSIKPLPPPALKPVAVASATSALIVMDFDVKNCIASRRARCAVAVPKVAGLLAKARASGMLVVHFYNANMTREDIVPQVAPVGTETAQKASGNKFFNTDLDGVLKGRAITTVILAGTSANGAVLTTAIGAAERGYKVVVPIDVIPADDIWQEQFSIWQIANGPVLRDAATVTRTDMLEFGATAA
jgi:nicotinamidase-related amidase